MKKVILLLFLICVVAHSTILADQLRLKNGDRLTGQIVKSDGKALKLKTEYAGDLTVSLDAIEEIISDQPLYLTLNDGKTVFGIVSTRNGSYEVETNGGSKVAVEHNSIRTIRSASEQTAYERLLRPGWLELWSGVADFGFSMTTGNTKTKTVTLGANMARETGRDKTVLYAALINAKNRKDDVSETTANAIRGGGRYEINLTNRLSGFGFADFEHNEIQLLDMRTVLGGGLGYYIKKGERAQLQIFGGGAYNRENFSGGLRRNSAEALVGEDLTFRLSNRVSLKERLQFFPNLTERGEYRATLDSGVVTKMTNWLNWQVILSDRYLSNSVPGSKNNDLLFTTGVSLNFKR